MRAKNHSYSNIPLYFFYIVLIFSFELFVLIQSGSAELFNADNNTISKLAVENFYSNIYFSLPIIYFLLVHLLLHLAFIICSVKVFSVLTIQFNKNFINIKNGRSSATYILLCSLFITFNYFLLLIINSANYPNSIFSLYNLFNFSFLNNLNNKFAYLFAVIYLSSIFISGLLLTIRQYFKSNYFILISLLITFTILIFDKINLNYQSIVKPELKTPNIILLTIDSLRFDYLDKINSNEASFDITTFTNNSVSFTNAYTPLARSFPALYSILSGKHPSEEKIRFNLTKQESINFSDLLPSILANNNYETLYATDSNQFHIINKKWGYKYLVTPKQGIYEQFLPKINDTPLSNLIINTQLGEILFPYTYSNQSANKIYDPASYINRVTKNINKLNKTRPIFLHLNFEALHWPYQNRYLNLNIPFQERYEYCLNTVNWQLQKVFEYLKANHLLNNTIVVLASDHGEALSIKDDKIINTDNYIGKSQYLELIEKQPVNYTFAELEQVKATKNKAMLDAILDINTSGGHGVDLLSKSQYQVVLAVQKFNNGQPELDAREENSLVSLTDIYPTLLDMTNLTNTNQNNTFSLTKLFNPKSKNYPDSKTIFNSRELFLETGLQVPYFKIEELNNKNILNKFIKVWAQYYHINDENHLELTNDAVNKLLQTKQYAVINNNNLFAYIPRGLKQKWTVIKDSNNTHNCDIPRPVQNPDGSEAALLCGNYKESPGYFVYYNFTMDKWTIYPSKDDFKNIKLVNSLNSKLVDYYKNEYIDIIG